MTSPEWPRLFGRPLVALHPLAMPCLLGHLASTGAHNLPLTPWPNAHRSHVRPRRNAMGEPTHPPSVHRDIANNSRSGWGEEFFCVITSCAICGNFSPLSSTVSVQNRKGPKGSIDSGLGDTILHRNRMHVSIVAVVSLPLRMSFTGHLKAHLLLVLPHLNAHRRTLIWARAAHPQTNCPSAALLDGRMDHIDMTSSPNSTMASREQC